MVVSVNGVRKSKANKNEKSKSISFKFAAGDELEIIEKEKGIIKINSFKVEGEKLNVYCIILSKNKIKDNPFLIHI